MAPWSKFKQKAGNEHGYSHAHAAPYRRTGKLAVLFRFFIVMGALVTIAAWKNIGGLVPQTGFIGGAIHASSEAVSHEGLLQSTKSSSDASDSGSKKDELPAAVDSGASKITQETAAKDSSSKDQIGDKDRGSISAERDEDQSNNGVTAGVGGQTLTGSIDDDENTASEEDQQNQKHAEEDAAAAAAAPKLDGPFFTCPDGRVGLHIIHLPLLLDQTLEKGAAGVFIAGRMLMFRDFTLPSLAKQSSQDFVLYTSFDPNQDGAFVNAAQDAIKTQFQNGPGYMYVADNPKYFMNKPDKMLAFPRVANLLVEHHVVSRKEVQSVTLYITSKMDADDAVHRDAARRIQEESCSQVGPEQTDRLLATRIGPKVAWFPHANTTYGVLATPAEDSELEEKERIEREMSEKAHMQSLAVDVSLMLCQAPLNCYSVGEGDPTTMLSLATADDCPFEFEADRNMVDITIDEGNEIGALYSRPPLVGDAARVPPGVNFTIDILDLKGFKPIEFNLDAITGCGISPGELSATNLLLASVYAEAPYVAGRSAVDARGWGTPGGLVNAPHVTGDEEDSAVLEGDGMDEDTPRDAVQLDDEERGGDDEDDGEESGQVGSGQEEDGEEDYNATE